MEQHSPVRTQGDGMENAADDPPKLENLKTPKVTHSSSLLYRPVGLNGISVPPPPAPGSMVKLVPKHAIQYKKKKIGIVGNMSSKEPKFVPYEPYKAAVMPMVPLEKAKSEKKEKKHITDLNDIRMANLAIQVGKQEAEKIAEASSKEWDGEKKAMQDEIAKLKEENVKLDSQLKFQAQVNTDLKTLLVAAVGEDLEMRVQLLTEDKLQLARALLSSAQVCTNHQERTEFLAGQCEVWRSKFLASSLMLEDLAHRKAGLTDHATQLEEITRKLLEERAAIWNTEKMSYRWLSGLRDGFAPGTAESIPTPISIAELSACNERTSKALRSQLLVGRNTTEPSLDHLTPDTTIEDSALKLLGGVVGLERQDAACNAVMGAAIAIATRQPVCCSHCSGEVKTV